ncbi:MAG: tetratricopeptide repeat protein [Microcoleaceae cyanobacterium]
MIFDIKELDLYLKDAKSLTSKGKLSEAIQIYRSAIELKPDDAKLYHYLGDALARYKQTEEAISCFRKAIDIDSNFFSSYHRLGEVLQSKGCYDEAISSYSNAIELNPNNFRSHFNLGRVFAHKSQWSKAVASYTKAIAINQSDAMVYHYLGEALTGLKEYKKAIACFKNAVELDSNLAMAHHRLGDVLQSQGYIDEAIIYYSRAIELNSDNFWSYFNLGAALDKKERNSEAIQCYQKAIELNPNFAEAHCNLGYALTRQGQLKQAINSYRNSSREYILASYPELVNQSLNLETLCEPNFIIIGSMKAGTTSLYNYISQHPHFLPCIRKEIDFFSIRYDKGIDWYLAHFPKVPKESNFFTGEASTSYLDYPKVPQRLYQHFPDVKLIAILRNPVERAFSHYHHKKKYHPGKEQRSFEEAIGEEMNFLEQLENPILQAYSNTDDPFGHLRSGYLLRGLYIYFIQQWIDLFPKEQIKIFKSEEFYDNPEAVMKQVFEFLEVSDHQLASYPQYNSGSYSPISDKVRQKLSDFFHVHNQKLENYLNIELGWQ